MNPELRIVTRLPLHELWGEEDLLLAGGRIRHLEQRDVKQLLREESMRFVVAECGSPLNWVSKSDRFAFWKSVSAQVAEPDKPTYLDQFSQDVPMSRPNGKEMRASV